MIHYLYKRDSKEKVRVFKLEIIKTDIGYDLIRTTGLLNGKLTSQPKVSIDKGKAKRTVEEQSTLQANSMINKQLDGGYKRFTDLTKDVDLNGRLDPETDYEFIESILVKGQTYANGNKKVMLALDPKPITDFNWNKDWWISRKLDGIRAKIRIDENNEYEAITRNGKIINSPFTRIFKCSEFKKIFDILGKDVSLDGELYTHGVPLQTLAGSASLKNYTPERHDQLEFWIFDYMHDTETAEERILKLNKLSNLFPDSDCIKIVSHVKLNNYASIKTIHDLFVSQGFEGAIARNASSTYQYGCKNAAMVKVKEFQDDEFEILGLKEGLRDEDMCFICKLPNGNTVDVKPMGTKTVKLDYIENIENLIGKMLTVKFFNYTEDGSLFLPVGKTIRNYE